MATLEEEFQAFVRKVNTEFRLIAALVEQIQESKERLQVLQYEYNEREEKCTTSEPRWWSLYGLRREGLLDVNALQKIEAAGWTVSSLEC